MIRRAVALVALAAVALGCAQLGGGDREQTPQEKTGLAGILERGELVVGMTGEQPPLNMTTKSGELVGLEVALARVLAQVIGVKLRLEPLPFAQLIPAVESRKIDMAMSGIGITPQRNVRVAFVGPYFVSGKSLLSKNPQVLAVKSPAELNRADIRIAALAGSTSEDYVRRNLPQAKLVPVTGLDQGVQMVMRGEVEALLADLETCYFAELRFPDSGVKALGRTFTLEPMGIAVPPGDAQLINLLGNYLNTLERQGALARARDYWFENRDWLEALR